MRRAPKRKNCWVHYILMYSRPADHRTGAVLPVHLEDEFLSMLPGPEAEALAGQTMMFEEFVARESAAGRFDINFEPAPARKLLLHGHCHQKAFAAVSAVQAICN